MLFIIQRRPTMSVYDFPIDVACELHVIHHIVEMAHLQTSVWIIILNQTYRCYCWAKKKTSLVPHRCTLTLGGEALLFDCDGIRMDSLASVRFWSLRPSSLPFPFFVISWNREALNNQDMEKSIEVESCFFGVEARVPKGHGWNDCPTPKLHHSPLAGAILSLSQELGWVAFPDPKWGAY